MCLFIKSVCVCTHAFRITASATLVLPAFILLEFRMLLSSSSFQGLKSNHELANRSPHKVIILNSNLLYENNKIFNSVIRAIAPQISCFEIIGL